jgi:hypothetical protein
MITDEQITKAADEGTMVNIDVLAHWCDQAGFPFFLGLAILQKESGGKNVYGHDVGGALSGYPDPPDENNFRVFRWMIDVAKQASNGVGPMQITYKGYFPLMDKLGLKPWIPYDNIRYGIQNILTPSFLAQRKTQADRKAFWAMANAYNTGKATTSPAPYADDALVQADKWAAIVGTGDTLVKWTAA